MNFFNFCIVCIVCIGSGLQAQVVDDFSDGNFNTNPEWVGDALYFEVNSAKQLHLKSQGSDTSVLLTRIGDLPDTEWDFWMKLSFNTSSNNFARICLASDTMTLFSGMNGYFLQAGGADDSIYIIRQTGTIQEKVFRFHSYKTLHSTNTMRIKITRDPGGGWEVMADTTGGTNYLTEGSFSDPAAMHMKWFGVWCRYTSSNATKFYFDDFYVGRILRDTIAPGIISMDIPSERVIRVDFSEAIETQSAETPSNYQLSPAGGNPDSVRMDSQKARVTLYLHDPLAEGVTGSLLIRNLADLAGNPLPETQLPVCYYRPKPYDVVINEIMADPDPSVGLPPGKEWIELKNTSLYPVNLLGWHLSDGSNTDRKSTRLNSSH